MKTKIEKVSQILPARGTKCNVMTWMEFWNRKRMLPVRKQWHANQVWGRLNTNIPVLISYLMLASALFGCKRWR